MRILVFCAYYEPEVAASLYLSTNLYEDMAKNGWEVDLFTPLPTRGIDSKTRKFYKKKKLELKYDGKLRIHRISLFQEGKNPLIRAFRYFLLNLLFIWKGLRTPTDIIFVRSTPPTQGAMGVILKKLKKVPLVYNLQDIFPDSLVNVGLTKKDSMIFKIGKLIENFTYKNTDKLVVVSEDFRKNLINKKVPKNKIENVYNWVEADNVVPIKKEDNILYSKYNINPSNFNVVYAGNLGLAQNIEIILETAKMVMDFNDIKFLIFGKGAQEQEYMRMAKDYNLNNVEFYPMQPYKDVSHVYSMGDVCLVTCKPGFGESAMPSKTWNIMAAGSALIANFDKDTDMQRIVENNNTGLFTSSGNVNELKEALIKLYNNDELRSKMGHNGRKFIVENLTRSSGTKKYMDIIQSVEGGSTNV